MEAETVFVLAIFSVFFVVGASLFYYACCVTDNEEATKKLRESLKRRRSSVKVRRFERTRSVGVVVLSNVLRRPSSHRQATSAHYVPNTSIHLSFVYPDLILSLSKHRARSFVIANSARLSLRAIDFDDSHVAVSTHVSARPRKPLGWYSSHAAHARSFPASSRIQRRWVLYTPK